MQRTAWANGRFVFVPILMRIDEPLAAVGMVVAAIDIEHASIRHLDPRHDLSELKQEPHRLPTLVADRIVWVLDQHRIAADVGNVGSVKVVTVDIWTKDLGENGEAKGR